MQRIWMVIGSFMTYQYVEVAVKVMATDSDASERWK